MPLRRRPRRDPDEFCATIVVGNAVTKPDALAVVALSVDTGIERLRTLSPRVPLGSGVWVEVELPKTGEPPPLALDVYSTVGADHARSHAIELESVLRRMTNWNLRLDFDA